MIEGVREPTWNFRGSRTWHVVEHFHLQEGFICSCLPLCSWHGCGYIGLTFLAAVSVPSTSNRAMIRGFLAGDIVDVGKARTEMVQGRSV